MSLQGNFVHRAALKDVFSIQFPAVSSRWRRVIWFLEFYVPAVSGDMTEGFVADIGWTLTEVKWNDWLSISNAGHSPSMFETSFEFITFIWLIRLVFLSAFLKRPDLVRDGLP